MLDSEGVVSLIFLGLADNIVCSYASRTASKISFVLFLKNFLKLAFKVDYFGSS